VFLIKYLFF